ncbi:uncharacterized protein [Palaemon carinicauda]|uniref:uncharacterized protein isoform X2 n=1 Tax=Palaemon carinicauda TaxID=392227 RepID=UPI0035B62828
MMWWAVFPLLLCMCRQASPLHIPTKESLCGLIVDIDYKEECLQCFTAAGPLQENPEAFRLCVATYLPPLVAKCAVPHAKGLQLARIHQYKPVVHLNHTNANLLPNCLKRRMRELSRYLQKENTFTEQAGGILKKIVNSNMIPSGGANMLNIVSQRYIICIPTVKKLVLAVAGSCVAGYDYSCESARSSLDDDSPMSNEGEESRPFGEWESDLVFEEDGGDDVRHEMDLRAKPSDKGNGLPYGGTNELAQEMIMGKCIIDALNENGLTLHLINIISDDEFFHAIPNMWAEPILRFYKSFRESLEN